VIDKGAIAAHAGVRSCIAVLKKRMRRYRRNAGIIIASPYNNGRAGNFVVRVCVQSALQIDLKFEI
jgi:hypothetical protein